MSLLSVGTVAFDDIETPMGKAENVIGGAATYIAVTASYFIKESQIVSVVGGDFPKEELAYLNERGVTLTAFKSKKTKNLFSGPANTTMI